METGEIIFWSVIAICAIVFIVIFSILLKEFRKLLKRAEKYGEEVRKKTKALNNGSKPKTFYEVIIEPSSGSDLSDVLKEMKILSTFIKLPMRAVFNNKKLPITSTTNLDVVASCYYKNIDIKNVHRI
ncbi:MAG: hypothetical protein E7020_03070 [Alphaproteobacteria bacterium]|nr:hypothetical protein [Alphaproteobacteria bacterium]